MSRPQRDAVRDERPQVFDEACCVVLRAGGRSGVHDHDVVVVERIQDGRLDESVVIRHGRQSIRGCAPLCDHSGQHQRVELYDVSRPQVLAGLDELAAGRYYGNPGLSADGHGGDACRRAGGKVLRAQPPPLREHELRRDDVLTQGADVLVRRDGLAYLDGLSVDLMHDLDHDDRVESFRHGVAGVGPPRLRPYG